MIPKEIAPLSGTTFFHVTTLDRLASIARDGFDPRFSRLGNGLLYLTPDLRHALAYAGHHGDETKAVVLRISGADLDETLLGPDDVDLADIVGDDWESYGWDASVKVSGQCTYSGTLRADAILGKACPGGEEAGEWRPVTELAADLGMEPLAVRP